MCVSPYECVCVCVCMCVCVLARECVGARLPMCSVNGRDSIFYITPIVINRLIPSALEKAPLYKTNKTNTTQLKVSSYCLVICLRYNFKQTLDSQQHKPITSTPRRCYSDKGLKKL